MLNGKNSDNPRCLSHDFFLKLQAAVIACALKRLMAVVAVRAKESYGDVVAG